MATKKARPDEAIGSEDLGPLRLTKRFRHAWWGLQHPSTVLGQAGDRNTTCTYALQPSHNHLLNIHFREFITLVR
jgi:hypothetical protein